MLNWLIENISDSGGIMKELRKIRLGELVDFQTGPFGTQFSASEYVNEGIPVINVKNIGVGMVIRENLDYISEQARDRLSQHILKTGDIVFGRKGSVDRHAYIFQNENGWVQGSDCIRARKKTPVNMLFLSQYLEGNGVKKQIINAAVGSTMPSLNTDILKDITVLLPNIEEQNRISVALKKIDDKICLNSKINDNLSAMAYDIYMHNFFSKKPNAKLKDILTEAEKSAIQVGEAKTSNGEYPFFTSGATILKWNEPFVDGRNCFLNTGGNADVKFYVGKAAYSTDTWSISAKSEMSDYLYLMLFSIKPELDQKFFQGTGLKHLQKPLLKDRPIYVPEKRELEAFNRQVMPMFDIISENTRENQQLTSLRNWLLPMLMNGQATISD
jgi:type I restriction enzyme S subunit